MESARVQREQTKSATVSGRSRRSGAHAPSNSRRPHTLNDGGQTLRLRHALGASRAFFPHALQAKLTVNEPGDQYEQEAARVADQVMRMSDPAIRLRKCGCGGSTASGESCEECASPSAQLQRRAMPNCRTDTAAPEIVHDVLRSPGRSLDTSIRALERRK